MTRLWRRLRGLAATLSGSRRPDRDLDDELSGYVEERTAKLIATGVSPGEARRRVLAEEGGLEAVKERTREVRAGALVATILQDLRYGVRTMRRAPGFSVIACLTLALGIGASIAMFTVMRSVLWRPLPYPQADRLIVLEVDARGVPNAGAAMGEVSDLRARSRTLEGLSVAIGVEAHVEVNGEVERVGAANVSDDLLPLLGARAALGRLLEARLDAGTPASPAAHGVVISDALWRRRFGADPHVIGRVVSINNGAREVVGVLAPGFRVFLPASIGTLEHTDVWFSTDIGEARDYRDVSAIGRLAQGHALEEAQREVTALAAQFEREYPSVYDGAAVRFRLRSVRDALTEPVDAGLRALGLAVAFVLVLSCVNLANLLIARGANRTRELQIRRALGASRPRLIRQLMTESMLLSAVGGGLGVLAGGWAVHAVEWLRPTHLPRQSQIGMDATVAAFAVAIAVVAGVLFGVIPALRLARRDTHPPAPGRGDTLGRATRRLQRGLVIVEIALSIVPLVAAGLMLRTFLNLSQAPLGFQPERVLTVWMPISFRQFAGFDARWRLHRDAIARVRALPGVEAVSAVSPAPFGPLQFQRRFGRGDDPAPSAVTSLQVVLPGYFDVAGTRVVEGRDFSDEDLALGRQVVVIDSRIAHALWPQGAVGERLALASGRKVVQLDVIGVTEPVRTRQVRDDVTPQVFVPYHFFSVEMALAIRTSTASMAPGLEPAIRRTIAELGTGRAVDVRPLSEFVRDSMAETRFTMLVLGAFALAAVLLAAVGLYGTLAYLASQRVREFGIRLALGSTRRQILGLVAGEGLRLTAIGAVLGVVGAFAAAQVLRRLLYGVEPADAATLVAVGVVVLGLGVAACLRPAWTASRTNPMTTLSSE